MTQTRYDLRPELLVIGGLVGLVGALAPNVLNLIAASIAEHDFVADTISDLGRGPHKWIMDLGFYLNAAGLIALALAAAHLHLGGWGWSVGILCLTLLALMTTLVGVWDDFGGRDLSVHTALTYFLFPLYLIGPLAMRSSIAKISPRPATLFVIAAGAWTVLSIGFKLAPNSYDGIVEKIAVLATLFWIVPLSLVFLREGRQRA